MWKRSRSWRSAAPRDAHRLDHLRARAPGGLGAERRALVAVQLQVREVQLLGGLRDLVERRVDEHADQLDAAAQRGRDARGDGRVGRARRVRPEDEAERPRTELDRELGVLGPGDAADLDARHARKRRRAALTRARQRGRAVGQRRLQPALARRPRVDLERRPRRPARGARGPPRRRPSSARGCPSSVLQQRRRRAAPPRRRASPAGPARPARRRRAGAALDAQVGALDVALLLELRDHLLGGVDGHGEADPDAAAGRRRRRSRSAS